MGSISKKLKMLLPFESDNFNINDFNENFKKIDALTHIPQSGVANSWRHKAGQLGVQDIRVVWHYKKFDDGTLEAYANFRVTDMTCNTADDGLFYSNYCHVDYPKLDQDSIFYRSVEVGGGEGTNIRNWACDDSQYGSSTSYQTFRLMSMRKETKAVVKNVYMTFKGTWKPS